MRARPQGAPTVALARKKSKPMVWHPLSELDSAPVAAHLRPLIGVAGSLTQTLRRSCNGGFRLRLLGERPALTSPARVREVLMLCDETPWVFAQTVIPDSTLSEYPWLDRLGDTPLGDTLFDRDGVERRELRFGLLQAGERLYERAVLRAGLGELPEALWARRSVIRIGAHDLLVNEVFLPQAGDCVAR